MPKGLKRAASALLIATGLYSLLGFLILPGIGLRVANQQLTQLATVPARLGEYHVVLGSLSLHIVPKKTRHAALAFAVDGVGDAEPLLVEP